jgi:hypothetical protein
MSRVKLRIEIENLNLPAAPTLNEYAIREQVRREIVQAISPGSSPPPGAPQASLLSPARIGEAVRRAISSMKF